MLNNLNGSVKAFKREINKTKFTKRVHQSPWPYLHISLFIYDHLRNASPVNMEVFQVLQILPPMPQS
jgi:hypothetical protein